ncbi:glucokinase [Streptomyces nodosus]|uniref:ROK family protein n=1 Tax=Streptomyces nodosus TaxID=40318 RepID=A0A5P2W159_9ACTN|nr:ROK family protein [Streptomyces nodosus]MBB4796254.1 glucokinase [Streptomyces nodosus]QEV37209.1 ROK family protein [Streptomyces nodosus]
MTALIPAPCDLVVADLGGTTLRVGRIGAGTSEVRDVQRVPTDGLGRYGALAPQELQDRVVEQLGREIAARLACPGQPPAQAVAVSFAGPMTSDGVVLAGPTLWGGPAAPLPIADVLAKHLGLPVVAANDVTAAAWRYASAESEPFCLTTVSSGIGNKVFRHGEIVIDEHGYGGEIGHWLVDPAQDAAPCECGGRGHLGAIASGRGALFAVRAAAAADTVAFARSALAEPSGGVPDGITNEAFAAAARAGDRFARESLRRSLQPLASAVSLLFTAIGVRRYLFVGGFALALGDTFLTLLGDELVRIGCFGLDERATRAMLALGEDDDDHCLIGIGQLAADRLGTPGALEATA